jgi:hypothetical protein
MEFVSSEQEQEQEQEQENTNDMVSENNNENSNEVTFEFVDNRPVYTAEELAKLYETNILGESSVKDFYQSLLISLHDIETDNIESEANFVDVTFPALFHNSFLKDYKYNCFVNENNEEDIMKHVWIHNESELKRLSTDIIYFLNVYIVPTLNNTVQSIIYELQNTDETKEEPIDRKETETNQFDYIKKLINFCNKMQTGEFYIKLLDDLSHINN